MSEIRIEQPSEEQVKSLGLPDQPLNNGTWSVWECDPSSFDWHYDSTEVAYVYEGKVKVKTDKGEVEIKKGDLVTFPAGLDCTWNVVDKIRKVYMFK